MKVSPADSRMVYVVYKTQATVSASAANAQNTPKKKKNRRVVARFNLKNTAKQTLFILRDCVALDVSEDGQYLVAATRTKMHVWTLATNEEVIHTLSYDITSLTIHPNGNCIAVGDRVGRITLWYCLNGPQDTKPVITTMHWHAHQVNDLAFTNDGEYLLSGGEEAVLVIWQLQTRSKQFLPRLGADILSIAVSPDQMYYAVGQSDNTVRIVSSVNLTITQAVVGLKCAQLNRKIYPLSTGIVVEPRNNYVVMNGAPGSLQFFNPYTDRHVLELEVTPGNRVSRTEEKEIIRPHVTQLAFSPSGDWMITVDVRDSGETEPEVYLKFWAYNADSQTYWVNTRVDNPHGAKITSLRCGPMTATGALMAVTTSVQDRKFKVWQLTEHAEGEFHWSCRSVGYYKDLPAYDAAFSEDGSILAVSFGQVITLWDPTTNGLQMVMTCPPPVRNAVGFGNTESAVTDGTFQLTFCNGGSPYLVSSTDKYLHVWNLLTCSVWWSYRLNVKRIMADPSSANFLVWADLDNETSTQTPSNESPKRKVPLKHQQILVFHPSSPTPVAVQEVDRRCQAVTFGRKSSASASSTKEALADVLLVTNQFELQRLSDESKVAGDNGDDVKDTNEPASEFLDDKPKSFLSSLYGDSAISQVQPATATSSESQPTPTPVPSVGKSSFKFIDIPTFMLPVPSKLAVPFFESILAKASPSQSELQSTTESSTEEKQESTSMMDIDTPPQTDTTASANKATELEDFEDGAMDFMADFFKTRMG
ncbi:WD repeat-containing protein 75 [Quaeritorhiza haematococci]|nr:WD repeat-containing protein 75 [Quaeritorhiza haematococci]